jgi:hypothetical protein
MRRAPTADARGQERAAPIDKCAHAVSLPVTISPPFEERANTAVVLTGHL